MVSIAVGLLLAAAPIQKIDPPPKIEAPKLDLRLPEVPKANDLSGPSKATELETRRAAGDQGSTGTPGVAKVESVVHARDFAAGKSGRKPVGRIDGFTFATLPGKVAPFKTCVRLASPDGVPVVLKVAVKSPAGTELLSSRADVSFGGAGAMDVVIEWDGFEAGQAGEYKVVVSVDGRTSGEFPLAIQAK